MIDDPFKDTFELDNNIVGPEIWQYRTAWYTVAVRFNKLTEQFLLVAVGIIDGEEFMASDSFQICPQFDQATKTFLDNAFRRAGEKVRKSEIHSENPM